MQPRSGANKPRPPRQKPAWMLAVIDIALIVVCLLVFALFDHVIPQPGVKAVYTPATPQPTQEPAEPEQQAQAAQPLDVDEATPQPTATPAPVGDFSAKFADKFTSGEVIQTDSTYQSANVNITLTRYETTIGTYLETYFVQDIYIRSIDCLRTVFAKDTYGKSISEDVLSMAQRTGSIAAINSDYYGYGNAGIVIRNGTLYRSDFEPGEEVLIIYRDGTMRVFQGEKDLDVNQAMADGAWQSFSFGPGLLDENGDLRAEGYARVNHDPRTLIGMIEPGHYLFIVIDGRQKGYADGMTYKGCAELCQQLGCTVAYNLDGGRTSQMTFMGQMVNQPYKDGRPTSDMIYIADVGA